METLSVNLQILLQNTFPQFNYPEHDLKIGIVKKLELIADSVNSQFGFKKFDDFASHKSDSIKALACYLLSKQPFSFKEKLHLIQNLADDTNSGVREWAWLALRPCFVHDLHENMGYLALFNNRSANLRRFTSEISRPRGVWCKHITEFRESPWLGLEILEPMKSDDSRYVQLSVGNWLNDASKDHPDWVRKICIEWLEIFPNKNTGYICKRALRTITQRKYVVL